MTHFAIRTGLRRGELMELRWFDLNLETRPAYVRVRRSLRRCPDGSWQPKDPKSYRPRSVPLSPDVVAMLNMLPRTAPQALVFPGKRGGTFSDVAFYRALVKAARDAGLGKHVHPHLLRHTFASHSMKIGVPIRRVQRWLGHASVATTERYAHLRLEAGDELIDGLASAGAIPAAQILGDKWATNSPKIEETPYSGS